MIYLLIILFIIILIIFLALFKHLTIEVNLKDNLLSLKFIHLFYKKSIEIDLNKPKPQKKKSTADSEKKAGSFDMLKQRIFSKEKGIDFDELKNIKNEYISAYSQILNIIKDFSKRARCKIKIPTLNISLDIGTSNPAATGMIYGSIFNAVGIFYPILRQYFDIVYPNLDITPDFYQERFKISIKSIIKVKAVHIITALTPPLFTYFKNIKNKKDVNKNGR